MSSVDNQLGGANTECFIRGTPTYGGFSLGSLVAGMQCRHHLDSWNAIGWGEAGGGGVREAESLLYQSGGGM